MPSQLQYETIILEFQKPSIDASELHKFRRLTNFQILNICEKFGQGLLVAYHHLGFACERAFDTRDPITQITDWFWSKQREIDKKETERERLKNDALNFVAF